MEHDVESLKGLNLNLKLNLKLKFQLWSSEVKNLYKVILSHIGSWGSVWPRRSPVSKAKQKGRISWISVISTNVLHQNLAFRIPKEISSSISIVQWKSQNTSDENRKWCYQWDTLRKET